MDFKIAIDAVLGFFQNILGYLTEGLIEGNPLALAITTLLVIAFFTLLWRAFIWKIIKKSTSTAYESADEAVKAVIKQSLEDIKEDIDNRLSIIHGETKESVRATLLEFKKAELDSLSQSLTQQVKECRAEAEQPTPEPVKPVEEEVKLNDLEKHLLLTKIHKDDLSPRTQFYVRQEVLGKNIQCCDHSFITKWSNLFKDFSKESTAVLLKDKLERDLFVMVFVCPKCGSVWAYLDISRLDLPKIHDENEEEAAEKESDYVLPATTFPAAHLNEVPANNQPYVEESVKEVTEEETRVPTPNPEPVPEELSEPMEINEPTAALPELTSVPEPILLPAEFPITNFILSTDEELEQEMQKANDELKAGIREALKEDNPAPADDTADEEAVQEKAPEEPEAPPIPTILPSAISGFAWTKDDEISEEIEEALKDDDAKQPAPQPRLDETTLLIPIPDLPAPEPEPIAKPETFISSRPVLTYPGSEKKEKRGFMLRISFNKQRRLEAKQEKEQRKRQEARMKWEEKRQRNKEVLTEKIRKRKKAEEKKREKEFRKVLKRKSLARKSRSHSR